MKKAEQNTRALNLAILFVGLLPLSLGGCGSSATESNAGGSGGSTLSGVGGNTSSSNVGGNTSSSNVGGNTSASDPIVGYFSVVLNPAVDATAAYTTVFGKAYTGPVLTSVIETPAASNAQCKVYAFSQQSCTNPSCTTQQSCVAANVCKDNPTLVSVGEVSITGVGGSSIKLSAINKNYQYAGEITYPGFAEGDTITLTAKGDYYPEFSVSAKGVSPIALSESSYTIASGSPLALKWDPSGSAVKANVNLGLNISKHGGSAGYLSCDVEDTGSYTIPADLITSLINLGVAGFPQLTVTRSSRGTSAVTQGVVQLAVQSLAIPNLQVEGYCSCFNSADCGSCADKTKTTCDTVKKLCNAP
ncbi:MAG TPA: hypothetical protein VIV60_04390 [Polyangiaceae bacterium]